MHGKLVLAFMCKENMAPSRIREISDFLSNHQEMVFIVTTPSEKTFQKYIKQFDRSISMYNRNDFIPPSRLFSASWGFHAIWMFNEQNMESFELSGDNIWVNLPSQNTHAPGLTMLF